MSWNSSSRQLFKWVGKRIRDQRKSQKIGQEELAKRVSLSRTSITNIELGKQRLLVDQLYTFANALSIEPMKLLPTRAELSETLPDRHIKAQKLTGAQKKWVENIVLGKQEDK